MDKNHYVFYKANKKVNFFYEIFEIVAGKKNTLYESK